ncbi:MAG: hypothetical protein MZV63_27005 [Marinilabiliales bacterium]|nr:hypothetical protein [Marinilabiliales bacterium]
MPALWIRRQLSLSRRDADHPDKNPSGIQEQDLIDAIDVVFRQNIGLDHEEPLSEFIENEGIDSCWYG